MVVGEVGGGKGGGGGGLWGGGGGGAERILPAKLYLPGLLADTQFGNRMKNAVHRIVLWITTQHFLCLLWRIRGESGGKP